MGRGSQSRGSTSGPRGSTRHDHSPGGWPFTTRALQWAPAVCQCEWLCESRLKPLGFCSRRLRCLVQEMAATMKVRAWITEERCYQESRGKSGEGEGGILFQLGLSGAQEGPQGPGLCLCQVAGELVEGRPDHHHPLHYFLKICI